MEQIYYTNFLSVVVQNDNFDTAMELYNKLVPHSSTPMYNFFSILMNHLHTNGALQYLGKVIIKIELYSFDNKLFFRSGTTSCCLTTALPPGRISTS